VPGLDDLPPPEQGAAPGWYPDPLGGKLPRWWNGSEWTCRAGEESEEPLGPGEDPQVPKRPRQPTALIGATFRLYGRFPLLFALLAAGVIVPYDLMVLAATGQGPYTTSDASISVQIVLTAIPWIAIGPLVSALHVHAVSDLRDGSEPEIADVALRACECCRSSQQRRSCRASASFSGSSP
jgi:hypothetical protein